jgi:hypothetical protein
VIIPGLGSFSKTGPDDPKTTFNPYLKFNDGFLAGFIAKKQGISMDDAGKLIADNVEKINDALDRKGEAMVMGLGILKKTGDGKLEFIPDANAGEGTTPPIAKTPEKPKPEIQPEKKPEIKPVEPEKKPEIKPEPKPEIKPEKEKPAVPPKEVSNNKAVKVNAPGLTSVGTAGKDDKVKKEKEKKVKPPKPPRPEGEKAKKKFPVVLVIILVLVAGGATFATLKWDMVKGWIGMNEEAQTTKTEEKGKPVEEKKAGPVATEPMTDTAVVAETTEEPVVAEEVKSEKHPVKKETVKEHVKEPVQHHYASTGNFHVIVNCFSMEQNANRMVEKLNAEGHQGNNLGLRGGFYMVEAGSFSSMEDAKSKLEALKSVYPKAWIYSGS